MYFSTEARDCLYVNWAVPLAQAPALPAPLRYERHPGSGGEVVFFSALCFRMSGLRPEALPLPGISYPQLTFRTYVLDGDNVPSVLFVHVWVPFWVAPLTRYLGRQPASPGLLSFPPPTRQGMADDFEWRVRGSEKLAIHARLAAPIVGEKPDLGSFHRTVEYFRRRPRGYVHLDGKVRAIERSHPQVEVLPLQVEIEDKALLRAIWPQVESTVWDRPHSAWLCPEIPFTFELGPPIRLPMAAPLPAASARF